MISIVLLVVLILLNSLFISLFFLKVTLIENQVSLKAKVIIVLAMFIVILGFGFSNVVWMQYVVTALILFFMVLALGIQITEWEKLLFMIGFIILLASFINYLEGRLISAISHQLQHEVMSSFVLGIIFQTVNLMIIFRLPQEFYFRLFRALDRNSFFVITSILLVIMLVYFLSYTINGNSIRNDGRVIDPNEMSLLVIVGLFIILGLINFGMYRQKKRDEKERIQQLLDYTKEIENLVDELALFRHDYLNILLSLRLGIENKNFEMIEQIFEDVIMPTEKFVNNQTVEIARINKLRIPELKSILYMKLNHAKLQGITVSLDIPATIYKIPIDHVEYIRIFSILIDNAIESAKESLDKKIDVLILEDNGVQILQIGNSTQETVVDLTNIYEKYYTTKNVKEKERGLGLYYLLALVKRTDGVYLETQSDRHYFTQILKIMRK